MVLLVVVLWEALGDGDDVVRVRILELGPSPPLCGNAGLGDGPTCSCQAIVICWQWCVEAPIAIGCFFVIWYLFG